MKTIIILLLIIFTANITKSQNNYVRSNEKIIYKFKTKKNKILVIAGDTANKYIVYRYGTKNNIELEYPKDYSKSWDKFKYSYYMRGGVNNGRELVYLYFINGNYKYVTYSEYYSEDGSTYCGIKLVNTKTNKIIDIEGDSKTIEGSLSDLTDNEKINMTNDISF